MAEKISVLPLNSLLEKDDRLINALLHAGERVICRNSATGKIRNILFRALYANDKRFWLNANSDWDYFLDKKTYESIKANLLEKAGNAVPLYEGIGEDIDTESDFKEKNSHDEKSGEDSSGSVNFGQEYFQIESAALPARIEKVNEGKSRLDILIGQKEKDFETVAEALVETSRDVALINRATLLEAMRMGDEEARALTQDLVDSTQEMVKSTTKLVTEDIFNNELVKTLVLKSNGTVIQHMTRVFLNGVSFLAYYNNLVHRSSISNKLRIGFEKKYRKYYRKLLPHLHEDDVTLERVFYKGMMAVPDQEFNNWSTGFLIHDIGKAQAIEYHEGESAYDRNIVVDHVKVGYTAVMNKTNYPRQAGLITGYHHEYYGDPNGYGYFRAYLARYKKDNPKATQDYCISFELEPMLDYQALAYFPAKVLEIVDVFDSLTDPNRKYRKALSPEEALTMMREEFIDKHLKIDPVLFDIFKGFIREKIAS
jgi:HD-GYP domain-containing protein (c-di-GMP phosphodiesterase class II)